MTRPSDLTPQKYEVVKLKTGSEVVGMVRDTTKGIEITLPMICQFQHWKLIELLQPSIRMHPLVQTQIVIRYDQMM